MANPTFLLPGDERWERMLNRVSHDVYHRPEYVELFSRFSNAEPCAFYAAHDDHELLIPFLKRRLPEDLSEDGFDLLSPYGLPSPLTYGDDPQVLHSLSEIFREYARSEGCVSAFLRLNPLLPFADHCFSSDGELITHGRTVYVDLTEREEFRSSFRKSHRRVIHKLQREGYAVTINEWNYLPQFIALYEETMQRVSATEFYFFNPGFYEALRESLPRETFLFTVLGPCGRVVASSIVFACNGIVQHFLTGTDPGYLKKAPGKLLVDTLLTWAKERGEKLVHLGGGAGGVEDGIFHFKCGFSDKTAPFKTLRIVLNKERYDELVQIRRAKFDLVDCSYFPLYRGAGRVYEARDEVHDMRAMG